MKTITSRPASTPQSLEITPDDLVMSDTADVTFELINP